jgi:hypothetical protein
MNGKSTFLRALKSIRNHSGCKKYVPESPREKKFPGHFLTLKTFFY